MLAQKLQCAKPRHSSLPLWTSAVLDVQARNEELARRAAKVSEDDMAAAQAEFEARCVTAERKVPTSKGTCCVALTFMAGSCRMHAVVLMGGS